MRRSWVIVGLLAIMCVEHGMELEKKKPYCMMLSIESVSEIPLFDDPECGFDPKSTLVVLDVDETLIHGKDVFVRNRNTEQADLVQRDFRKMYPDGLEDLENIWMIDAERPLIEPTIVETIQKLLEKGFLVLLCTAMKDEIIGDVHMPEWRYKQLKKVGLQWSFEDKTCSFANVFVKKWNEFYKPSMYKGIIITDLAPKGEVVERVLQEFDLTHQTIIMVDDKKHNLQSVEKMCMNRDREFLGYEYTGSKLLPWDNELVVFQWNYLAQHKKWLSDDVARKKMQEYKAIKNNTITKLQDARNEQKRLKDSKKTRGKSQELILKLMP